MSKQGPRDRLKPLSVYPLTPEEALAAFMQVDPEKVNRRLKEAKKQRNQRKASKKKRGK
ncbi:hypothetical protein LCGC14_1189970 [marine sediment metagenome]|uniref:Uncharacterized protein n=1 Tax=marine sediment metagenome TaxID=412755 RepID=A0A0F9M7G5_9ZZZZ